MYRDIKAATSSNSVERTQETTGAETYCNMPPTAPQNYHNQAFLLRYISQGAQKKTGFRQLRNIDKERLKEVTAAPYKEETTTQ